MTAGPYDPPKSDVRDVGPDQEIRERPAEVRSATIYLWISLGIGVINTFLGIGGTPNPSAIAFSVVVLGVMALFIVGIRAGINWVRILYLVLFLLGLLPTLFTLSALFNYSSLIGSLSLAQIFLQASGLYLVFTKPGSLWFHRTRA